MKMKLSRLTGSLRRSEDNQLNNYETFKQMISSTVLQSQWFSASLKHIYNIHGCILNLTRLSRWRKLCTVTFSQTHFLAASSMRTRSASSRAARSSRPRPMAAAPTSTTARPTRSASSSPSAGHRSCSRRTRWLSLTSASSSPARGRRRLTLSARWKRTSTVAWWVHRATCKVKKGGLCDSFIALLFFWFFFFLFSGAPMFSFATRSLFLHPILSVTRLVSNNPQ